MSKKKNFSEQEFSTNTEVTETVVEKPVKREVTKHKGIVQCLLNIRKEPKGDIVGTYDAGTQIEYEVLRTPDWIKTNQGYVMRKYVD